MYTFSTQSIAFEDVLNARDLGGYRMPDGQRIRRGLLLRGGSLAALSEASSARFTNEFQLAYDFDFRTEAEVFHAPDRVPVGAQRVWLPAIDPELERLGTQSLPAEAYRDLPHYLLDHACRPEVQRVAHGLYLDMVVNEYTQLQYAAFLQMTSHLDAGAVFWHCSQGKDRTGLAAAFLLAALGADRDLILCDFNISNEYYQADVDLLLAQLHAQGRGTAEEEAVIRTFIGVNTDYFIEALDLIDQRYGGLDAYIHQQLLLTDGDIIRLRYRLLE